MPKRFLPLRCALFHESFSLVATRVKLFGTATDVLLLLYNTHRALKFQRVFEKVGNVAVGDAIVLTKVLHITE